VYYFGFEHDRLTGMRKVLPAVADAFLAVAAAIVISIAVWHLLYAAVRERSTMAKINDALKGEPGCCVLGEHLPASCSEGGGARRATPRCRPWSDSQIIEALDAFYATPKNLNIPIPNALRIIASRVTGVPESEIQKQVESARQTFPHPDSQEERK
jgi:hypothetical protein